MGKGRRRSQEAPDVEPDQIQPVDVDGVRVIAILTIGWAVAFVVLAFAINWLDSNGRGWWLWTCLAGVGLGLLGLEYTRKRRDALEPSDDAEAPEAAEHDGASSPEAGPSTSALPGQSKPPTRATRANRPASDAELPSALSKPPGRIEGLAADRGAERAGDASTGLPPTRQQAVPEAVTRPIDGGGGSATGIPGVSGSVQPSRHSRPGQPRRSPSADAASQRRRAPGIMPAAVPDGIPGKVPGATPGATAGDLSPGSQSTGRPRADRERSADRRIVEAPASELFGDIAVRPSSRPSVAPVTPSKPSVSPGTSAPRAGSAGHPAAADDLTGSLTRSAPAPSIEDDEPLLDTTLGGGRRARRHDMTEEIDEITEGGGRHYRGRRARRSDSA